VSNTEYFVFAVVLHLVM